MKRKPYLVGWVDYTETITCFDVVIDSCKYTYKVYNTQWSDSLKYKKVFTFKDVNKLKALGEVVEKTILKNKP